jgi:transposase
MPLTVDNVIEMRARARETKRLDLRGNAARYGVSHPTIYLAMTGRTFKLVPGPLSKDEYEVTNGRTHKMTAEDIAAIVELRESNPGLWTYATLAQRCNRMHGMHYGPSNVQRLIEKAAGKRIKRPMSDTATPRKKREKKPTVAKPIAAPAGMKTIDTSSAEARRALAARLIAGRGK